MLTADRAAWQCLHKRHWISELDLFVGEALQAALEDNGAVACDVTMGVDVSADNGAETEKGGPVDNAEEFWPEPDDTVGTGVAHTERSQRAPAACPGAGMESLSRSRRRLALHASKRRFQLSAAAMLEKEDVSWLPSCHASTSFSAASDLSGILKNLQIYFSILKQSSQPSYHASLQFNH